MLIITADGRTYSYTDLNIRDRNQYKYECCNINRKRNIQMPTILVPPVVGNDIKAKMDALPNTPVIIDFQSPDGNPFYNVRQDDFNSFKVLLDFGDAKIK